MMSWNSSPGTPLYAGERIWRYAVPIDDNWHGFALQGDPLYVACRQTAEATGGHPIIEFWARAQPNGLPGTHREFMVIGTGHLVPTDVRIWGTAIDGPFVWHLLERWPPPIEVPSLAIEGVTTS